MIFISIFILAGMLAVSAIHFAWACGSTFPANDEKTLAKTVAGFRGIEKMPPTTASAIVGLVTFASGLWPFVLMNSIGQDLPPWFVTMGGAVLTLVFCLRGAIGFTKAWRTLTPEQPFARLDQKYYSPFCFAIGVAFAILTILRFT